MLDIIRDHKILFALIVLFIILILWIIWSNSAIEITQHTISSKSIPKAFDGFKIAQVSDLHNKEYGDNNQELLDFIRNEKPDIIVITGDLLDCRNTDYNVAIQFCKGAAEIAPTYYITGNHEAWLTELNLLTETLEHWGVTYLANEAVTLNKDNQSIRLVGMTDTMFTAVYEEKSFDEVLRQLTPECKDYTILLSHKPDLFDTYAANDVDLVLTGHTHGGQIRLPFLGGVYVPDQGFFPKYDAGIFTQNQTTMIISRGLGDSVFPFRFNNRPEIILVELKSEN